jgi:hypothetical protein
MRTAIGLLVALVWAGSLAPGGAEGQGRVTTTATLTVLAGTVQRAPAGGGAPRPASSGTSLAVGDRVLTGPGATALITFLDGSTVTVQPGADVTVARADLAPRSSRIGLRVSAGAVWARVVRLLDADSGMTLESNTASATVHTGLIGAQQDPDGTFVCWTQSPGLTVTDPTGRRVVLQAGQRATLRAGQEPAVQPFRVHRSTLRVAAPAGLLPLLAMPDGARVAGFVAPGIEVNQVFGSATARGEDGRRHVEVPAGLPGPYRLVLEAAEAVDDAVTWAVLLDGAVVHQQALPVRVPRGGRLATTVSPRFDPAAPPGPRAARVVDASARPLAAFDGPLPGQVLLSPAEVASAGGR